MSVCKHHNTKAQKHYFDYFPLIHTPYFVEREAPSNAVYRAYRLPYDWIPQLDTPVERAVVPPALGEFRIAPQ